MSHIKTIQDLNTSVGELASLMNDTFTCCMKNYDALLKYIGKKETNFKIYHKLVQVNILLKKLSEELIGLRVEFVTMSSNEETRETVLSEGHRKRGKSDVLKLGRCETKSVPMEIPFSNSSKCCIALTSGTGIVMQSENLVSMDTEETRHTQVQKMDMQRKKNIKTELQGSDEVEDLLVSPIDYCEIPAAQASFDNLSNGVKISFAGDVESCCVADKNVRANACNKLSGMITQRENAEVCFPLQSAENKTNNQEKCEETENVLSKEHGIHRGLGGEVDCNIPFPYQPESPFSSEESPIAFTPCNWESDRFLEGRSNKENKRAPVFPVVCANDESSNEQCNAEDELYGVIRHQHQNKKYNCILCNCQVVGYQAMRVHVKGKKHKKKRITAKKNSCARVSEVPNNRRESELVNYQVVHGYMKKKNHKRKRITAKNKCAKDSEVPNNSCKNELVNYQVGHGHVKGKNHKRKQITAKLPEINNSCPKVPEVTNNTTQCKVM